jgi:hypothetical protein
VFRTGAVVAALAWYAPAEVLEVWAVDHGAYGMGQVVSGHTLKHPAVATGAYCLFRMLGRRRPVPAPCLTGAG